MGMESELHCCLVTVQLKCSLNASLIISCLEGLFPSVPLTRTSDYSLVQKPAGLRAVHSIGGCAVGRALDLHTESRWWCKRSQVHLLQWQETGHVPTGDSHLGPSAEG